MSKNLKKKKNKRPIEAISVASHQLKTPLSVIKGYLEVLISEDVGELNSKQKDYLNDILKNTQKMEEFLTHLLEVSKIERGELELNARKVDLKEIVRQEVEDFKILAKAKNCQLNLNIENEDKIPKIKIAPLKIIEVIDNLISNAIEYNQDKGEVLITIKRKEDKLVFCCQDSGMGISEEDQDKIFKKFYRSEKALSRLPVGSGLGLFISKAIIEKSGGEIWFDSEEGKGSTFCFSLPIE